MRAQRVHLIGVGGAGLSGAAKLLVEAGHAVSGTDLVATPFSNALRGLGIPIELGASRAAMLPTDAELVVRSAAVGTDDPQVVRAHELGLEVIKYSELLARLGEPQRTLAVAGTHGKTTTAWMALHALAAMEAHGLPATGCLIGGSERLLGTNALAPARDGWFVVEACEYDRSFLNLAPHAAILTNVEADHLDYYGSYEQLERAFARFAGSVHPNGLIVAGRDVPESVTNQALCRVWREGVEFRVEWLNEKRGCLRFRVIGPGWATPPVQLPVPGEFNVSNATLAVVLAVGLAQTDPRVADPQAAAIDAAIGLESFGGVERRFEPWGDVDGIAVVHDYAHHPTEIRATLEAARRAFAGRPLHVVFQPHQHSRTARFLPDFVEALRGADSVVVADVYGARAHIDDQSAGAPELVRRLKKATVPAHLGGGLDTIVAATTDAIADDCVLMVLGAGDIDGIKDELMRELAVCRTPAGEPS